MTEASQLRDDELLLAVGAGDRQALEELYLGYHDRLARFLSRCTPGAEAVEEIISDTFMAVWQGGIACRHPSQASTWIMSIAYRTMLKSLGRKNALAPGQIVHKPPEHTSDPTQNDETKDLMSDGLNRLSLEQRLTLVLAYCMGHSLREIAAITDSPAEAVNARMFHACQKMRLYLSPLGGGDAFDHRERVTPIQ